MASDHEELTCDICCECFDDKNLCPRVLSCGHSFCSDCLGKCMEYTTIDCPTCRETSTFPMPNGVEDLPKNFALLGIIETINATPQQADNIVSPICKEIEALAMSLNEQIIAAIVRVLDATLDMLKTLEHLAASIRACFRLELQAALITREQFLKNELDHFFTENTGDVSAVGLPNIFAFLRTKDAREHRCLLNLAEAVSKCRRDEMEALATNARTADEARVTGAILDLKEACEGVACEIKGVFKTLQAELTAREKVLIDELGNLYIEKHSILLKQFQRLQVFQARIDSTIQPVICNTQSLNHDNLLAVRSNIKSMFGEIESRCIVLEPEAEYEPQVTFDQITMWSLQHLDCHKLSCAIESMGAVSDKSTCAATTDAAGFGLMCAQLGNKASFTITAYDAQGCRRGLGSDVFVVELKENAGEGKVAVNLENKGNGTYLATYTVPEDARTGDYTLSVLLRGAHILYSPFVVCVGH